MKQYITNSSIVDFVREFGIVTVIVVILFFIGVHIVRVVAEEAIIVAKAQCVMPGLVVGDSVILHGDRYIVTRSDLLTGLGDYWLELQKPNK